MLDEAVFPGCLDKVVTTSFNQGNLLRSMREKAKVLYAVGIKV